MEQKQIHSSDCIIFDSKSPKVARDVFLEIDEGIHLARCTFLFCIIAEILLLLALVAKPNIALVIEIKQLVLRISFFLGTTLVKFLGCRKSDTYNG